MDNQLMNYIEEEAIRLYRRLYKYNSNAYTEEECLKRVKDIYQYEVYVGILHIANNFDWMKKI